MREIRQAVNLAKKHLKKTFEIKNAQEVIIHELIAYQRNWDKKQNYSRGEFDPDKPEFPKNLRESERNERFVNRISQYIQSLFDFAAKKHAKANFVNGDQYISPLDLRATALQNLMKEVKFQTPRSFFSITAKQIEKDELKMKKKERKADLAPISPEQIDEEVSFLKFMDPPKPLKMRLDKMNTITRLNLHEFALYPYIDRGPLSLQEWQLLLKNINEMAATYPENLHIMLGTVPVRTQTIINSKKINLLQNIGVYVECGPNPRIHVFGKTIPATAGEFKDLIYPKTAVSAASQGDAGTFATCQSLLNLMNKISHKLTECPRTLSLKEIEFLIEQCAQIKLDPPAYQNDLIVCLNTLSEGITAGKYVTEQRRADKESANSLMAKQLSRLFFQFFTQYVGQFQPSSALQDLSQQNNIIRLKDRIVEKIKSAPHELTKQEFDELKGYCDQLKLPMLKISNLYFVLDSLSSAIQQSPPSEFKLPADAATQLEEAINKLLANITPQFDIQYGGSFVVATAGKARIRVNAEICVEHKAGRARKLTKEQIALARKQGTELLPTKGSHIVISNRVALDSRFQVSDSLTHSDPLYPKGYSYVRTKSGKQLAAIEGCQFINPSFGLETRVDSYPPQVVQPLTKEFKEEIELHNEFTLTLMAMQTYRTNNPIEINMIDRMIIQHILGPFVDHIISAKLSRDKNPFYICLLKLYESSFSYDETIAILHELHHIPEEKQSAAFKKQLEITFSLLISEQGASNKIRKEMGDIKPQEFKTSSIDDIDKCMLEKLAKIVNPTAVAKDQVKLIGWSPPQKDETKKGKSSLFSRFEVEPKPERQAKQGKSKTAKR